LIFHSTFSEKGSVVDHLFGWNNGTNT